MGVFHRNLDWDWTIAPDNLAANHLPLNSYSVLHNTPFRVYVRSTPSIHILYRSSAFFFCREKRKAAPRPSARTEAAEVGRNRLHILFTPYFIYHRRTTCYFIPSAHLPHPPYSFSTLIETHQRGHLQLTQINGAISDVTHVAPLHQH